MTKPEPKARHKNALCRFRLLSELVNLDRSFFEHQLVEILTKEMFTTMQWHSLLTLWQTRRPYESNEVLIFLASFSLAQLQQSPQAITQVMTQAECVDQMWDQYASKVLKPGCVLDYHLTLEQLINHECQCTQDNRNLLAGLLVVLEAEGNLL